MAWEPQSYGIRVVEANLVGLIQQDCNVRQQEAITTKPISQDIQTIAMLLGETSNSPTPLNIPYHTTLKLIFSFYRCSDAIAQQDGTYRTYLITAISFHEDILPIKEDVSLPFSHTWPASMHYLVPPQEAGCHIPLASPWHISNLHPGRVSAPPKLLKQIVLNFLIESFHSNQVI